MPRSSRFGHVETVSSGKFRARCTGPDGVRRSKTFKTKTDAQVWLSSMETSIAQKTWRPPEGGNTTVGTYADSYLARQDLRPSTRELYETTWRVRLRDAWANVPVADVSVDRVRAWHARASKSTGPTALAIAYRLLRSILNVAVADGVIAANPCRTGTAAAPRPAKPARTLTAAEVRVVADAVPSRYRSLVLVLGFGGLRFGEATALRRCDIEKGGQFIRVERIVRYVGKKWLVGPPKTDAGRRTVALPTFVGDALETTSTASSERRLTHSSSAQRQGTTWRVRTSRRPSRAHCGVPICRLRAFTGFATPVRHWPHQQELAPANSCTDWGTPPPRLR
jgi:integrase